MKRISIMAICIALLFIGASCSDEMSGYGTLSATVSDASGSKTIQPSADDLTFEKFRIEGFYVADTNKKVGETFTSTSVSIDHLEVGTWRFTVKGYNKAGILLAQSSAHKVEIKPNGVSKETYALEWLYEGEGSLSLELEVQSSRVASIECTLSKDGAEVGRYSMSQEQRTVGTDGMYRFSGVFDGIQAGSYVAELSMKNGDGSSFGVTRHVVVRIHPNLASSYSFSWKGYANLLPKVDAPKVAGIEEGYSIPCNGTVKLSTVEDGTSIYYSLDGGGFVEYQAEGIDLSAYSNLKDRLEIRAYATKDGMNRSEVVTKVYGVVHNPDRGNASYDWKKVSGGYECVASSKCLIHGSFVCETERASKTTKEVLKKPTCAEYGTDRYTCTFAIEGYDEQVWDFSVSKLPHSYVDVVDDKYLESKATCMKRAAYYKSCSVCEASSNSSSYTFEYGEALGHDYKDFTCIRCKIWMKGPAGGCVFYDCDADNDSGNADGLVSSECGWRYLEAAPADLRIVDGKPTVDSTASGYDSAKNWYIFGYCRTSADGSNTNTSIGSGEANTQKLVDAMRDNAYTSLSGSGTTADYAARLCSELVHGGFNDWFLPSKEELNLMYRNLKKEGIGSFADYPYDYYWSSSESDATYAWAQTFSSGHQTGNRYRDSGGHVRPIRAF